MVVQIGTNLEAGACSNRNFGWYILGGIDADFSADGFFWRRLPRNTSRYRSKRHSADLRRSQNVTFRKVAHFLANIDSYIDTIECGFLRWILWSLYFLANTNSLVKIFDFILVLQIHGICSQYLNRLRYVVHRIYFVFSSSSFWIWYNLNATFALEKWWKLMTIDLDLVSEEERFPSSRAIFISEKLHDKCISICQFRKMYIH